VVFVSSIFLASAKGVPAGAFVGSTAGLVSEPAAVEVRRFAPDGVLFVKDRAELVSTASSNVS